MHVDRASKAKVERFCCQLEIPFVYDTVDTVTSIGESAPSHPGRQSGLHFALLYEKRRPVITHRVDIASRKECGSDRVNASIGGRFVHPPWVTWITRRRWYHRKIGLLGPSSQVPRRSVEVCLSSWEDDKIRNWLGKLWSIHLGSGTLGNCEKLSDKEGMS